ncbi:MAG: hypothetical protein U5K69_03695 [Balneolaceae bacterium]|nr:hypothetical protein [Balneolaceae bacterium]
MGSNQVDFGGISSPSSGYSQPSSFDGSRIHAKSGSSLTGINKPFQLVGSADASHEGDIFIPAGIVDAKQGFQDKRLQAVSIQLLLRCRSHRQWEA